MNKFKTILLIILLNGMVMSQNYDFEQSLYYNYEFFKEKSLQNRFFKHSDVVRLITNLKKKNLFEVKVAGKSFEGREIFLLSVGSGTKKIFLWSQMHGDEPTATMALFDIFNFFSDTTQYQDVKKLILEKTKIYFMPMVNPDGAEVFKRRNALSIDLNRDASRLQTPEAKILMTVFDSLKADFGFNLHDQNHRYSAGNSFKSAAISFLAPPINYEKEVDEVRLNAIKLIGSLFKMLNKYVPGHIAKYSDDYEPRAFGDTFQRKGTSTILVESGGWQNDPEKQFIRKLNFILLLSALKQIAENSFVQTSESVYESIPFNEEKMFDVLLRNITFEKNGTEIKIDIGINFEEVLAEDKKTVYKKASIEDIGDLSVFFAYQDIDLSGYKIQEAKTYKAKNFTSEELKNINLTDFYKQGYLTLCTKKEIRKEWFEYPINILSDNKKEVRTKFEIGARPNFILKMNNRVDYVVINGFLHRVSDSNNYKGNGLVFK
ncbi:M14 family zinc carboxypeptidase [Ignavibacterium album]|uniref:M14 family zinc carboxypeptidase n=1 Tax=Ignavibacterium album TaxID=591197 RepID=UPI0026F32730|nr:M14 family zinc carboxypeptidase [Ignavibacterium album]